MSTATTERFAWLAELKAGDTVIIKHSMSMALVNVDRVTESQIVIGECRYNRKDGTRRGEHSSWNPRSVLIEATEARRCQIETEKLAERFGRMNQVDWKAFGRDRLKYLAAIVDEWKEGLATGESSR